MNTVVNDIPHQCSFSAPRLATQLGLFVVILCVAFFMNIVKASAQTSAGSITGTVQDTQHAIIPDAAITIRSVETGQVLSVKSSGSGVYAANSVPAGSYVVTASKQGFSDVEVTSVMVTVGTPSTVNITMVPGSVSQTVTVSAQTQMLDQSTPTFTTAVPQAISENLPLPERSAMEAVMLAPGVQGDPSANMGVSSEIPGVYTAPIIPGGTLAVGGSRPGAALQLVDGVDMSMVGYPRVGITFSGDDLKQITVQSTGITARYGRSGGGVINQESRGGTLQYHGKVAYRHIDPFFEATTYGQGTLTFTTPNGPIVKPVTPNSHQQMYTAVFSGPVPIRWHHINQNTFFFASYEPLSQSSKAWTRTRVPTPEELSGNFSNSFTLLNTTILSQQGYAAAIAAPRVGGLDYQFPLNSAGFPNGAHYTSPSQYVPIPNYNLSAQLNQNAFAKFVLSQFPQPSAGSLGNGYINFYNAQATYANDGTNALTARTGSTTDKRYNIRVDQNLGSSDHVFARYTDVPVNGLRANFLGQDSPLNPVPVSTIDSQTALVDFTHIFRGNALNDIRTSYTRMNYLVAPAPSTVNADYAAKYGLTPSFMGAGFPTLNLDAVSVGSSTGGNDGGTSLNEVYSIADDFSIVVGKHNLQFGGEWRAMQLNRLPNSGIYGGSYSFGAGSTNNGSSGGNSTATFILGSISGVTLSPIQEFYYRFKYLGAYAMDTWKLLPNLTLDLGLRYSLEFPRTEKFGLQGSFLPNLVGSLNGVAATGGFAFSGTNGLPKTLYPVNYMGFEPRIGFSYLVMPKMTLRGSYTLMHAPMTGITNSNIPALTPGSLSIGGANGGADPTAWVNYITNPVALPASGIPQILKPPTPVFSYGTGYLPYISQSNAVPYSESWSASMQYQPSASTLVQAAYVGNSSKHLLTPPQPLNTLDYNTMVASIQAGTNFSSTTKSIYGIGSGNSYINNLPYPQFYNNPILTGWVRSSSANYNALYLNGMARVKGGLTLISSFTWSKSLDDGSTGTQDGIGTGIYGDNYPQAPFSKAGEYSYSTYDIPVHLTAAYNWTLPVGRGKALNLRNSVLNALFGGLSTSGIFNAESGTPLWVNLGTAGYYFSTLPLCTGGNTTNCTKGSAPSYGSGGIPLAPQSISAGGGHGAFGAWNLRPNLVPGQPIILRNWRKDPFNYSGNGGYVNYDAFSVPGSPGNPQLGNAPRTLGARNPRVIYFDMHGSKTIPLHSDRITLILSADAINALNHTNFLVNPNTSHSISSSLNSSTGQYTKNANFGPAGNNTPGRVFAVGAAVTF